MPDLESFNVATSTSEAAFATNRRNVIVSWNGQAERLLGHSAERAVGMPCHEVICGRDIFGNRFCHEVCSPAIMAERREPIRDFELDVRHASGEMIRSRISVIVLRDKADGEFTVLHMLRQDREPSEDSGRAGHAAGSRAARSPRVSADRQRSAARKRKMTARELEVLRLLARGTSTSSMANQLGISQTTVRNHVQSILRKLEVHSKVEAVAMAFRDDLL